MKYKTYMDDSAKTSRLGFGGWTLGNVSQGKKMTEEEGVKLVKEAYRKGITFYDTAPNYSNGLSEKILGVALNGIRSNVVINSKFGHHADGTIDFSEDKIIASVEGSLKRLQTTYLDSVILHNPDWSVLNNETNHFKILKELKNEGKILGYGVSVDTREELGAVLDNLDVDTVEILFNIFSQNNRVHFKTLKQRNIKVIVKVPLDSGWLTGKFDKNSTFDDIRSRWSKEDIIKRDHLVTELRKIIPPSKSMIDYAIGFILDFEAVTTVIPGIRTTDQLELQFNAIKTWISHKDKQKLLDFHDQHIGDSPLPW